MNLQHASGWAALLMGCLVKATILLAVAWILTIAARRSSASFKHLLWAAAILTCLVLPLLTIALPAWHASAPSTGPALGSSRYSVEPHTRLEDLSAMAIDAAVTVPITTMGVAALLSVWFLGFVYLAARMLAGLVRLRRIRARSGPLEEASWIETTALFSRSLEIGRPVRLLLSRNPAAMPMTWGGFSSGGAASRRSKRLAGASPPRGADSRTGSCGALRLAFYYLRGDRVRRLLVPSPGLAGRAQAPPGKRTGLGRRRSANGSSRAGLCSSTAGARRRLE